MFENFFCQIIRGVTATRNPSDPRKLTLPITFLQCANVDMESSLRRPPVFGNDIKNRFAIDERLDRNCTVKHFVQEILYKEGVIERKY